MRQRNNKYSRIYANQLGIAMQLQQMRDDADNVMRNMHDSMRICADASANFDARPSLEPLCISKNGAWPPLLEMDF